MSASMYASGWHSFISMAQHLGRVLRKTRASEEIIARLFMRERARACRACGGEVVNMLANRA